MEINPLQFFNDINVQNQRFKEGENHVPDIRRDAQEWVKSHQNLFDGWLEEARKA